MKISFNPSNSNKNILDLIKNNKDIIFDLKGHSIFARGVEFKGTDTNTWRDIKINNVSIGSHTLDLQNGSNTTLTNTNGIVTINSTWRPVVDNLTSDSTTSSLSAKQGKVLKALIDSKSNSDHNHDGRYLKLTGGTMAGNALITFADSGSWDTSKKPQGARGGLYWSGQSDYAKLYAEETAEDNLDLVIQFGDDDSNGLSIRNKANIQTSYISAGGVITTGTFKGNLDWSYITNKPASYTPYALTISLNGTSQGPYDGSAAKNINITPGSIGAAVSNHSHDYLVVNSADDKSFNSAYHNFQVLYAGGGNKITGKPANVDAFGLFKFRVAIGCSGQMLLANGGSLYIRSSDDAKMTNTLAWKTILDSSNYSGILDSRYYTESEVNSLLDAKLNRQNLSYSNWNPRGYHLAADYHYNGGDLSISESGGKIHVSVDGYFWQNEGQYRVLDTSDIGDIRDSVTLYQYLSATDATWYPLVWGGAYHNNTSDSTGPIYKSYDKLCWQTSSQTLYATNIQTQNIKSLSIGGGIYWNPYVESASDGSDAASITLVRSGVAGGTTLVLSQMNDTNDTIQFKTNTAARLYHNNYPILTTQNTYVSNNKGYINGTEITQVNNSDMVDGYHANGLLTALSNSNNGISITVGGTTKSISNINVNYAASAGNANTLDGIDSTRFLRQVVVPNNTENDFNTFSNMTLTGRVDPTTGASLKNAPWSGSGPAGGYGVLTYLFNGSEYGTQMAWGYNDNRIYIRNRYWGGSGVGSVWRTSWDTLALTSDIPTVTNYYWANVKVSAFSSTTTSPTVLNLTATNSIRMGNILLEHTNEINNSANDSIHLNLRNSGNVSLCVGGGKVGIGTMQPSQELYVLGYTHTKGFGIGIQYLSESEWLPTISPGDGYVYRCLEIGRPTKVSCIIADKVPLSRGVRGLLLKFMQGFDGQIVLLKDLETYGSGNGYFWVMPSGCKIINADNSSILIDQNQIRNTYDDGRSRFFIYSSKYSVWIEFFCSNVY